MKIFTLDEDDNWPFNYDFNVERQWGLPGVNCSSCGRTWTDVGGCYPWLKLPSNLDETPYLKRWPVTPERLDELRQPLIPRLPFPMPLPPGVGFGLMRGRCFGKLGDIAWPYGWSPLMHVEVKTHLQNLGIRLETSPVQITDRKKAAIPYEEIHLYPVVKPSFPLEELCPKCGYLASPPEEIEPRPLVVGEIKKTPHYDFFGGWLISGVYVTERAAEALKKLNVSNCTIREVQFG